jgi:hypothetical protein
MWDHNGRKKIDLDVLNRPAKKPIRIAGEQSKSRVGQF